jgi:hypothetical protein
MLKISICLLLFLSVYQDTLGQYFYRFSTDFSVKEEMPDGSQALTLGTIYYDAHQRKLVMDIDFPEKKVIYAHDSLVYTIVDDSVFRKSNTFINFFEGNLYHLALTNELNSFGLENSGAYEITDIQRNNNRLISTWEPLGKYKDVTGKILTLNEGKKLTGIVFYNKDGKLLSKQNLNDYRNYSGLLFPHEVVQQLYTEEEKYLYKLYTYKNVVINEMGNENWYNYHLP